MDAKVTQRNALKAPTSHRDAQGEWYSLDNAGVIMPAQISRRMTGLFRLSATLTEAVDRKTLQAALDRMVARFPYYAVELRTGAFWHYLEPATLPLKVQDDEEPPSQDYDVRLRGRPLLRVRSRDRRIACEVNHALTDGTGALRFLKNLVAEYLRLRGLDLPPDPTLDLHDLSGPAHPEETEDAYNRYYPGDYPKPAPEAHAWQLPGPLLPVGAYRVTCGILPLAETKAAAARLGATITELLVGTYLASLQDCWLAQPEGRQRRALRRLSIEVPVNMRQFHPTRSNRNFSLFIHVDQDMGLGPRDLPTLVAKVHHQMRHEIDGPAMDRHIKRNVDGGRSLPVRLIPIFLKAPFMRFLYSFYGENLISGVLSNLGPVTLPPAMAEKVERLDFVPAPGPRQKTRASVLSYQDRIYVNFGSVGQATDLERHFFTRLVGLGIPVKIEGNQSGVASPSA